MKRIIFSLVGVAVLIAMGLAAVSPPPVPGNEGGVYDSGSVVSGSPLPQASNVGETPFCTTTGDYTVCTDKEDYAPGDTVHISGYGFAPGASLTIKVTRPDGSVVTGDGSFAPWPTAYDAVIANLDGKFDYNYVLDGIQGEYLVEAIAGDEVLASCTFTDCECSIKAFKFEDKDGDGVYDPPDEGPLQGWEFKLYRWEMRLIGFSWQWVLKSTETTEADGYADFGVTWTSGQYKIEETRQDCWDCTNCGDAEAAFPFTCSSPYGTTKVIKFGNRYSKPTPSAPDVTLCEGYTQADLEAAVATAGGGCDLGTTTITDNGDGTYTVECDNQGCVAEATGDITERVCEECGAIAPDFEICVNTPLDNALFISHGAGCLPIAGCSMVDLDCSGVDNSKVGTYSYTVTCSDGVSPDTDTGTVTVLPAPTATASSNSPVYVGATIQLYGGPDGMASYYWTGPNSFTSNSQNPTIPNATTAMAGTYTLTVTNSNDCTATNTTNVVVEVPVVPTGGVGGGGFCPTFRYLTVDWEGNNTTKPLYRNDRLTQDLLGPSPDGSHSLLLEQSTLAPTVNGKRHYLIVIRELEEIPPLPENTIALMAFNITPAGAVFDRDIFLTLGFDELPENALNATMAYYDDINGVWVPLEYEAGGPNGVAELTLSAPINHFSIFGVLAELEPTPTPPPAHFEASGLNIELSVEKIWKPVTFVTKTGESVTITANVLNDGGQEGTYTVELKLNGATVDTEIVTLGAGQSQPVSFTVSGLAYGQYEVEVAGLTDEFTTSRTITWWLIIVLVVALGVIIWGVVWGRRKR